MSEPAYLYAKHYHVDIVRRRISFELVTGERYEVAINKVSKRLKNVAGDALLDHYAIGGGVGIHWPMVDEDLSFRGLVRAATKRTKK